MINWMTDQDTNTMPIMVAHAFYPLKHERIEIADKFGNMWVIRLIWHNNYGLLSLSIKYIYKCSKHTLLVHHCEKYNNLI